MIVEFKVSNYRSINSEQTLSFVAENARRHPDNLIPRKGYKLLKAVGLFGANASGKSNLVKALGAMREFVRDSATRMNDGDSIPAAEPYRLDPATRNAPSRFEITFVAESLMYNYGFAADRQQVHEEWLTQAPEGTRRETTLFRRRRVDWGKLPHTYTSDHYDCIRWLNLLSERTRDNALALSVAARENVTEMLPAYRYLRDIIWTFDLSGSSYDLFRKAARHCENDERLRQQISLLLYDADTGIKSIGIESVSPAEAIPVRSGFSPQLKNFLLSVHAIGEVASLPRVTTSRHDKDDHPVQFDFEQDESAGTSRFFSVAVPILKALSLGAFIVIDELDASMHPLLTRRLLEMFQSAEANPNGAQLLFTTHDSALLDQELFRRDQIWLAEKYDGASTFFSLSDIRPPIRNTESFLRNYLTGRYGGTPHLGIAFDDFVTGAKA